MLNTSSTTAHCKIISHLKYIGRWNYLCSETWHEWFITTTDTSQRGLNDLKRLYFSIKPIIRCKCFDRNAQSLSAFTLQLLSEQRSKNYISQVAVRILVERSKTSNSCCLELEQQQTVELAKRLHLLFFCVVNCSSLLGDMSGKAKDILQMDLYGLLGIESTATTKEVCVN